MKKSKDGGDLRRQTSEERRAIIETWNAEEKLKNFKGTKELDNSVEDPRSKLMIQ